ncbi:PH domain-containing protein [Thermodesulfobacteriota bacterium]
MGYIENNLLVGEEVFYKTRLHWAIFIWPVILLVPAVWLLAEANKGSMAGAFFGVLLMFGGLIWILVVLARYYSSEFGVTNLRIVWKTGLLFRNTLEMMLSKVEGIQVEQDPFGRAFGFGNVIVTGTGGTQDPFKNIRAPLVFRQKVHEQIEGT